MGCIMNITLISTIFDFLTILNIFNSQGSCVAINIHKTVFSLPIVRARDYSYCSVKLFWFFISLL